MDQQHPQQEHARPNYGTQNGRPPPRPNKRCCSRRIGACACCLIFTVLTTLLFLAIGSGLYTYFSLLELNQKLTPGDSRLLTYSNVFCQSATIELMTSGVTADLYLVPDRPPLQTNVNNFEITNSNISVDAEDGFYSWRLHLYSSSNVQVSACFLDMQSYQFAVIKGEDSFSDWKKYRNSIEYDTHTISQPCSSGFYTFKYSTTSREDIYYFIIFANQEYQVPFQASVKLEVDRSDYMPIHSLNCTTSTSCTGYSSIFPFATPNQFALVTISEPFDDDWARTIELRYYCEPNIIAYPVVTILPFLLAVCCCCCVTCCCCCCFKNKNQQYQRLINPAEGTTVNMQATAPPPDQPPPPVPPNTRPPPYRV